MTARKPIYDPDLSLRAVPQIQWRCYTQGGILLNTLTGEVYKLNESGMHMWQLLMEGHSPQAMISALVQETGADPSLVERDIYIFVTSMIDQGLLCAAKTTQRADIEKG